jgi:8-oxo-dGTP pyrophosphatase MutT (NUDIX family)
MRTIHREIVSPFIFSNDRHILLGKSRSGGVYPGYLLIPGGGVKSGESLLEALKREVMEEVGLSLDAAKITHIKDSLSDMSGKTLSGTGEQVLVDMHFNIFRIDIPKHASSIKVSAGDDFTDVQWVAFNDLSSKKLVETTKKSLRDFGVLV